MKIGVTLPQFRDDAGDARRAARAADRAEGVDGVFVFDHLWAIGQPHRPSLSAWPLLGALAEITGRVHVGSLVIRAGVTPAALIGAQVRTLLRLAGRERTIIGLGAGDRLSRPENEALGIPFPPLAARVASLAAAAEAGLEAGAEVWLGGRAEPIRELAGRLRVTRNVWGVDAATFAAEVGRPLTWGGVQRDLDDGGGGLAATLVAVAKAGATWAVVAPDYRPGEPPEAAVDRLATTIAGVAKTVGSGSGAA